MAAGRSPTPPPSRGGPGWDAAGRWALWAGRRELNCRHASFGWHYLSNATCLAPPASFVLCVFPRIKDRGNLLHYPPLQKKPSIRQVHPVSITRSPSFRTQTLENLTPLPMKKRFLSNPDPGENLVSGNLVMETGCSARQGSHLSVLSQISNCQGLGRKNKHEILKTDRSARQIS